MACMQCNNSLPSDGDYVTCGKCNSNYHYDCSGIKKNTWKGKSAKLKSEWECPKCKNKKPRTQSVEEDPEIEDANVLALKKCIESMFKRQEKIISERVDNIMDVISHLEERFSNMFEKIKDLEEKTKALEKDIGDLKLTLECEKQYARSKNFIITSIPYSEKEDVSKIVVDLMHSMNINVKKEEFTAHRLPSGKNPSPIIVQCATRFTRDYIVRTARKCRPKLSLISNVNPDRSIYFNDHLTPYFSSLMGKANVIKKSMGFKYLWMNGNKIMLKKDNLSKAFQIVKQEDLDKVSQC